MKNEDLAIAVPAIIEFLEKKEDKIIHSNRTPGYKEGAMTIIVEVKSWLRQLPGHEGE